MANRPFTDIIAKLQRFEIELKAAMPAIVKEMAGVALSYKINQIRRNRGLFSNAKYSDNPGVPAYLYKGKNGDYPRALNSAGRAYINKQIKEGARFKGKKSRGGLSPFIKAGFVNWKGLRAAQGLPTSKVDLTYTGRMFQNVGVIDVRVLGPLYLATIGGRDKETIDKLKWNYIRYGDFLNLNGKAIALARENAKKRIEEIYQKIVLD